MTKLLTNLKEQTNWLEKFKLGGKPSKDQIKTALKKLLLDAELGIPEAKQRLDEIQSAAEAGDQNAQGLLLILQEIMAEQLPKAKCGKKLLKRPTAKVKKAGCGCKTKIAKFGSKLVEVDCNGIPVAKTGCKVKKAVEGSILSNITKKHLAEPFRNKLASDAAAPSTEGQNAHFYLGDDNKWYRQEYTPGQNGAAGTWGQEAEATDLGEVERFFLGENTAGLGNKPIYNNINKNAFVEGYDPVTGKFNTVDNSTKAGLSNVMKSGTSNYGFTISRDRSVDGDNIVDVTLDKNPERTARRGLRQDKRAVRNWLNSAEGKIYMKSHGVTAQDLKKGFGVNYTARQLMKGKGENTVLGQTAASAKEGIAQAVDWKVNHRPLLPKPEATPVAPQPTPTIAQSTTPVPKAKLEDLKLPSGVLNWKNGGWLHKFD